MLQHELTDDCNSLAEKGKLKEEEEEEEEQQAKEAGRQRAIAPLYVKFLHILIWTGICIKTESNY